MKYVQGKFVKEPPHERIERPGTYTSKKGKIDLNLLKQEFKKNNGGETIQGFFYKRLAEEHNYINVEEAKMFYTSFVRTLSFMVRKNGFVVLPFFGTLMYVACRRPHAWGPQKKMEKQYKDGKQKTYSMKFFMNQSLKNYLREKAKTKNKVDPREIFLDADYKVLVGKKSSFGLE